MRVFRADRAEPLAPPTRLDNGMLKADGRVSRSGIQEYQDASGKIRRELRRPSSVFDQKSLDSLKMVPVTNDHPPVLLDATNAKHYAVGYLGENVRRDGDYVAAPMMITDADAIAAVEAGKSQLSMGYTCRLDETPGVDPDLGPYDAEQLDIQGNHCALVVAGRAGPEACLRLDSRGNSLLPSPGEPKPPEGLSMPPQIRIDDQPFDVTEANASAIQQGITRALEAQKRKFDEQLVGEKKRADTAEKLHQTLKKNALALVGKVDRVRAVWDGMKARMMSCDECGGSGKVPTGDDAAKSQKCDYCDGKGSVRMHDAIKSVEPESEEHGEAGPDESDMDDAVEAAATDEDELEAEQATEEESKAAHKDAARAEKRKRAGAERKLWQEKRAASDQRRIDRAGKARSALALEAQKYLGADAKLDGLDAAGIKREVLKKLKPTLKLDGLDVEQAYAVAIADAIAPVAPAVDLVRGGVRPAAGQRNDAAGIDKARSEWAQSRADAWKTPTPASK